MALFENSTYQVLKSGLDAAWTQQQVNSHNLANSETPGFKAKKVNFQKVLEKASDGTSSWKYKTTVIEDDSTSARPDGNNVNTDKEELEMWQAYAQYSALSSRMNNKLANIRYVINNTGK